MDVEQASHLTREGSSHTPTSSFDGQVGPGSSRQAVSWIGHLCQHCHRPALELWRRIKLEIVVELPMLRQRWMIMAFGIVMQYVHGVFTQLAHRMHKPQEEPLHDVGFALTMELGPEKHWVSEAIFGTLFASFVIWSFTPFVLQRKRFYTVVMWSRLLMVLVVCQGLRIISFSVTQLPGPSFHCRAGELTATRAWPEHWTGHIIVDVSRQMSKGCGDLIFSSHTIFLLTGILAYNEYGSWIFTKAIAWVCGCIVSVLIVASRKHYTVDVVIAWYTVPLVFYTLHRRWTTRRPMSEFLGAIGENDEPDPSDAEMQALLPTHHNQLMVATQLEVKALRSNRASMPKLSGLEHHGAGEEQKQLGHSKQGS